MNRSALFAARLALASSMLLTGLAGLLLLAAIEASSGLPVDFLPEVVILGEVAAHDSACAPAREIKGARRPLVGSYEAVAAVTSCAG